MTWLPPFLIPMSEVPPVTVEAADVSDGLFAAVAGPTALGWIVTYILAIRQARQDGRVAIPAYLIAVNIAWEFSLTFLLEQTPTQRQINFLWLVFNVFLLAQALRYGPRDHLGMSPRTFRWTLAGVLVWAAVIVMVGANELRDLDGMYTGMIIQVPLSVSFILMLRRRGSSVGQSMYIAVAKTVGSLFAGLTAVLVHPAHHLLQVLVPTYVILDIAYVVLLRRVMRREGRPLWALRSPVTGTGASAEAPVPDTATAPASRAGLGTRSDDATA
ncbi:transmembrane-type terpene cyclase [Streptomyces cacaoi]|uniref:transmembrane-type terpene cyclase n=1 Tax=Streptomyces cacaoi TaxID=1898 RepID=UPI00374A6B45